MKIHRPWSGGPGAAFVLFLGMTALAALLDVLSGPDLLSVFLYVAPVSFLAARKGRRPGFAGAAAVAVVWFLVDVFSRPETDQPFLPLANAVAGLAVFLWVAHLAAPRRTPGGGGLLSRRAAAVTTAAALAVTGLVFLSAHAKRGGLERKPNHPDLVYWHGDPREKTVALTFDDGPNEPYTSQILEVLRENQVKATFFLIGKNVLADPEAARRVVAEGHAIGNHSFTHPDMIFEFNARVRDQIEETEQVIHLATEKWPLLFRPPFGADDPLTFHEIKRLGYVAVKWSVSSRDWERPGVDKIVQNVLKGLYNGGIVLMHDGNQCHGGDRGQTVEALRRLIPALKAQGYRFVTVPELIGLPEEKTFPTRP